MRGVCACKCPLLMSTASIRAKSGLSFVRAMQLRGTNYPPIGKWVDLKIRAVSRGKIAVSGVPTAKHYNPLNVVHGGFASTLMDLALGLVSITVLPNMQSGVSTIDLTVKYLRPIFKSTGRLICDAAVIYSGKRIVVAQARLRDSARKLYATAQSTCLVVPRR